VTDRVRIGVVGGGLVSQAMHLPKIALLGDRFELAGIADPAAGVAETLGARYGVPPFADHGSLIDAQRLDALLVCAPNAAHTAVVLDALDAGLHVLVEKPLCIRLADADAIVAARDRAGRVVQVAYTKRHDPAFAMLLDGLPSDASGLRFVSVVVQDPEFAPYFRPGDLVRGDVARDVASGLREAERAQVRDAVDTAQDEAVRAYSDGFLGSLVHQVNLVHGVLEALGEPLPGEVTGGDWWAEGAALSGSVRLTCGARWDSAWIHLPGVPEYREEITFMFEDGVHRLSFPSPWLAQDATAYTRSSTSDGGVLRTVAEQSYAGAFEQQLVHFHDCIASGVACRTPPEQARTDLVVLAQMFAAADRPGVTAVAR
jgi:predicted dehydrogenase